MAKVSAYPNLAA